mmetsp:Transcript_17958/g.44040  ORF Transcript_17958/g.44040 Transcript_17958/m.44040 type:complete len:205 (-) Transcript_17958:448-1062(-)
MLPSASSFPIPCPPSSLFPCIQKRPLALSWPAEYSPPKHTVRFLRLSPSESNVTNVVDGRLRMSATVASCVSSRTTSTLLCRNCCDSTNCDGILLLMMVPGSREVPAIAILCRTDRSSPSTVSIVGGSSTPPRCTRAHSLSIRSAKEPRVSSSFFFLPILRISFPHTPIPASIVSAYRDCASSSLRSTFDDAAATCQLPLSISP